MVQFFSASLQGSQLLRTRLSGYSARLFSFRFIILVILPLQTLLVDALRYTPGYEHYNLNQNATAENPLDYWGEWPNHSYHPSPKNWRMPIYTLFLDRFVNGDPSNDNANDTIYEHDPTSTNLRHGGDINGLVDSLDYLQGMGIKTIYIAGTPFINLPAGVDAYSPLDLTLLDAHFGSIEQWRDAITEIHARGMYIILDNTVSTLGPLLGYKGHLTKSAPFSAHEHQVVWKSERQYADFNFTNRDHADSCSYPTFYNSKGYPSYPKRKLGCYSGDFEQHGSSDAFENIPNWARSMTDFASVQDRLRDWKPDVMARITRFTCILVNMLDIDGFRVDKATQITVEGLVNWAEETRECARRLGKYNFFISGEVTANHALGAVYIGKGRSPDQYHEHLDAMSLARVPHKQHFLRNTGHVYGLEANAFHYTIHRKLARFLGLDPMHSSDNEDGDGEDEKSQDLPGLGQSVKPIDLDETFPVDLDNDFMDIWRHMMLSDDYTNPNTGEYDPRNMYGVSNQDVFRWPGLENGLERQILAQFITTFVLPGIPLMLWGEEQGFYVIDSTAKNYNFGRQAMSSSPAWKMHGCYQMGVSTYRQFPLQKALYGCHDDWNSLDHRDPTAPIRLISKHMFALQEQIPSLRDGFDVHPLSLNTHNVFLPGSKNPYIETGLWSGVRRPLEGLQDFSDSEYGNQAVWLLYSNEPKVIDYKFGCLSANAIVSPFPPGTIAKNLLFPYQEYEIQAGGNPNQMGSYGCLANLSLPAYAFMALVPKEKFVVAQPYITNFLPGHDTRVLSNRDQPESIEIELHFSTEMDCDSVSKSISILSKTENSTAVFIEETSINCGMLNVSRRKSTTLTAEPEGVWLFSATLRNVHHGVHRLTVNNASSIGGNSWTMAKDHFLLRIGQKDNPVVFSNANYTQGLLHRNNHGDISISHKASGADSFRYSLDWGVHYSPWQPYVGGQTRLNMSAVTNRKSERGQHVIVQYWSKLAGSSSQVQHGDLTSAMEPQLIKRFPHIFPQGRFNKFGYDTYSGDKGMKLEQHSTWSFPYMDEWPSSFVLNILGTDMKGKPDRNIIYGDINKDGVLDRISPQSFAKNVLKIKEGPKAPYLAWQFEVNDGTLKYSLKPIGSIIFQMKVFALLCIPVIFGSLGAVAFKRLYYQVILVGIEVDNRSPPILNGLNAWMHHYLSFYRGLKLSAEAEMDSVLPFSDMHPKHSRKTVLIATLEYSIPRYGIEVKIGGLGVIAKLFATSFPGDNMIWVVPKLGGTEYPKCEIADPINIIICGQFFSIEVSHLKVDNITYVILDAPVFCAQSKARPYPLRADDLESAVFYSAWNQSIAKVMGRFPVDIYHINDFHGALAPIYRLPMKIPICLTLHNADFQGLWPLRNVVETEEVCSIFNISQEACLTYVKCGSAFNLLHAAASYIRLYQGGVGVVGVSKDYGERSRARYPIFWGLSKIEGLPNPDPSDTTMLYDQTIKEKECGILTTGSPLPDPDERAIAKEKLQQWAGLKIGSNAEVLVFVGRWSSQKGIDIIADLAPILLTDYPALQIIAVGPIVDLLGRFSALKFDMLKQLYPGRVFAKTEFIAIPPFMSTGADFVLIPSRDEPFGLVQVEFGRKGTLCIGSRIGGLGDMPGWWYSVESSTTTHLISQFEAACRAALDSSPQVRAVMRAKGKTKRFPVGRWALKVGSLHSTAISHFQRFSTKDDELYWETKEKLEDAMAAFSWWPIKATKLRKDPSSGMSSPPWHEGYKPTKLSFSAVQGLREEFLLQTIENVFTDEDGTAVRAFEQSLLQLDIASSKGELSVESYLTRCQKLWFNICYDQNFAMSTGSAKVSLLRVCIGVFRTRKSDNSVSITSEKERLWGVKEKPSPLTQFLLYKLRDWPIYTILLALGQLLGGESCRISILSDPYDLSATRLYGLAATYCITTALWWRVYRRAEAIWVLCPPFFIYAAAIFLMGLAELSSLSSHRGFISGLAAFLYTSAASSTSFFLTENFGHEVGCQVSDWVFRACIIHGVQQVYVAGLWYVGSHPPSVELEHLALDGSHLKWWLPLISIPLAVVLCLIGIALFKGLPSCYRTLPPSMPAFNFSLRGRRTIFWFLLMIIIQNFFLSPLHGTNWSFLWSSASLSPLQTTSLVLFFLIPIWGILLLIFGKLSRHHSWILPIFAMGIGAPRWCQVFWGTSRLGAFLPWVGGGAAASSLVSRGLWLWLGLLDNVQGLGFGIILLQTLTRHHNTFVLACAQGMGSIAIILGKAIGPSPVVAFPNISGVEGTSHLFAETGCWFYAIFILQTIVCVMFIFGFRREQLWRP